MSRAPLPLLLLASLLIPVSGRLGAVEILQLDPATTKVAFHLGATGHDVEGNLFLRDAEIRLDPSTHAAQGEIVLDARRTESGNEKRDRKMHEEVLASGAHPWIVFRLEAFEGDLEHDESLKFRGEVEILGKTHPMTFATTVKRDGEAFEARGRLPVPFVEWGLEDPSILFLRVDKIVEVSIEAHGIWVHEVLHEEVHGEDQEEVVSAAGVGR